MRDKLDWVPARKDRLHERWEMISVDATGGYVSGSTCNGRSGRVVCALCARYAHCVCARPSLSLFLGSVVRSLSAVALVSFAGLLVVRVSTVS